MSICPKKTVMMQPICQVCGKFDKDDDGINVKEVDPINKLGFIYCDRDACKKTIETSSKKYMKEEKIIDMFSLFECVESMYNIDVLVRRSSGDIEKWYISGFKSLYDFSRGDFLIQCSSNDDMYSKFVKLRDIIENNPSNKHVEKIVEYATEHFSYCT